MWTVVYISRSKDRVGELVDILDKSGIMTMLHFTGHAGDDGAYEILVPKTELDEAQDIIFDTELSDK